MDETLHDDPFDGLSKDEIESIMERLAEEVYIERLIGDIDIELPDGTILKNKKLVRKEMLKPGTSEEVLCYQFVARTDEDDESDEYYLGTYKGDNLTIKVKEQ